MTQRDLRYLESVLALRSSHRVADRAEADGLLHAIDDPEAHHLANLITRRSRFAGARVADGKGVMWTSRIRPNPNAGYDEDSYTYVGRTTVYRVDGDDDAVADEVARLYLRDSLQNGADSQFAGWRGRIVAIIPEEVGPKESKVVRTTADGRIEICHRYNVLESYGLFAQWLTELALELDEYGGVASELAHEGGGGGLVEKIVAAWLQREAASVQLAQARHSLKFALGGHARVQRMLEQSVDDRPQVSTAELARSLYTDRANLSRAMAAASKDPSQAALLDA